MIIGIPVFSAVFRHRQVPLEKPWGARKQKTARGDFRAGGSSCELYQCSKFKVLVASSTQ